MRGLGNTSLDFIEDYISKNHENIIGAVTNFISSYISSYGDYTNHCRALELLIVNGSSHYLKWSGSYFEDGETRWDPNPLHIPPGGISFAVVSNVSSWLSSRKCVSGAFRYQIKGTDNCSLHLGFGSPFEGSYKHSISVEKGKSPQYGYELACKANNANIKSESINGFNVTCTKKEPVKMPWIPWYYNQLFIYTITDKDTDREGTPDSELERVNDTIQGGLTAVGKDKQLEDVIQGKTSQRKMNVAKDNPGRIKTRGMPDGSEGMPDGSGGMPYGSEGMPYGSEGMPYGSEGMPYGSEGMPYGSERMPNGSKGMAYGSEGMPNGSKGMAYGSERMPYGSEGIDQRSQETSVPSKRSTKACSENDQSYANHSQADLVRPAASTSSQREVSDVTKDTTYNKEAASYIIQVEEAADKDKQICDVPTCTIGEGKMNDISKDNNDDIKTSDMPAGSERSDQARQEGTAPSQSPTQAWGADQQLNANHNEAEQEQEAEQPKSTERNNSDTHNGRSVCCCLKRNTVAPE